MVSVRSKGWQAWVVHPDTDRPLPAEVLDDPEITPSLNTLPKIRVPVPTADFWQDLDGHPAMNVYKDGAEQPIDELVKPTDAKDSAAVLLEGRGGVELLDTVAREFRLERRHIAAQSVIDDETTYDSDVDTPTQAVLADQTQQDPDTTSELNAVITPGPTAPIDVSGGEVTVYQTSFTKDSLSFSSNNSGGSQTNNTGDGYNNGTYVEFTDLGDWQEWEFTPGYDSLELDTQVRVRVQGTGGDAPEVTVSIDGTDVGSSTPGNDSSPEWTNFGTLSTTAGDETKFSSGTHTLRVEATAAGTDTVRVDVVNVNDNGNRFAPNDFTYTFDDTLSSLQGWLDGPGDHPENGFDVVFDDATTPFNYIKAVASITIDDSGGDQRLQVSHDRGQTWNPSDGTEDNTTSVTIDPIPDPSVALRIRVRLDAYSPSGTRNQTPRENYDAQAIDALTLTADIRQESLVIDYAEEASIADHLTSIVGDDLFWSYRVVNGTPTVTVTQPGARTAASTPAAIEASVEKDLDTYHEFTVRGANKRVTDEEFSASLSFTNLAESNILPGSESVRDSGGVSYERGPDYEMNWRAGEIRAIDGGGLTVGDTYVIDYQHEVRGTHTDPNAPAGFRSRVVDIPAVTSARNAEQIAYILVEVDGFNAPRWVADIRVPPSVATFDVVEALPVEQLGVPASASPLEIEESPQVTPQGTAFRLGSRSEIESRLSDLRRQVRQVARRSG